MRIGIDLMGSEVSPLLLCEAIFSDIEGLPQGITFVVLGLDSVLKRLKKKRSRLSIEWISVEEEVTMEEKPLVAARRKKRSSMAVGISLLHKGEIDALISSGNTGALIASAALTLPKLPGIDRPALLTLLPTHQSPLAVLDVGANVSCRPHHIVQFASMGAVYQQCVQKKALSKVGLLNIGSEAGKGTAFVQEAYKALHTFCHSPSQREWIEFVGNIEGREAFEGSVDVLVCDGFMGNLFLKTAEGVAAFALERIKSAIQSSPNSSLHSVLAELQRYFDYEEYPGALVCGVDGLVIKCHGDSSSSAWKNAIAGAYKLHTRRLLNKMKKKLSSLI